MNTIDNIMELAEQYASQWENSYEWDKANTALRTALTEALTQDGSLICEGTKAQQSEQGWQDISTAPKDGTEIIIYSPPIQYFSVRYRNRRIAWWVCGQLGDYDGYWGTEVFFDGRSIVQHAHNATHWMPLPKPPKGDKS